MCGGSYALHETEVVPTSFDTRGYQDQRSEFATSEVIQFGARPIIQSLVNHLVETVVFPTSHRPIELESTIGGSQEDVLTGGDGVDVQVGEPARDVLLGGFALDTAAGLPCLAQPVLTADAEFIDAALDDILIDSLEIAGTALDSVGMA